MRSELSCRSMMNKAPPFKGLDIKIPFISPIKGGKFMNLGSTMRAVAI